MTLILVLGNRENVVQISDRRLTADGSIVDEESDKAGVLVCLNARMAFGYTGLASYRAFRTGEWLRKALHDAAKPDYQIGKILERLRDNATDVFSNDPSLKRAPPADKRLTVMFTGFVHLDQGAALGCAILSNWQGFNDVVKSKVAEASFSVYYQTIPLSVSAPFIVHAVGDQRALVSSELDQLSEMLLGLVPSHALIDKGYEILRRMAASPLSQGTIGEQLTGIVVPADHSLHAKTDYSSSCVKASVYMPSMVYLTPAIHFAVSDIKIEPVSADTPPLSVPRVRNNAICPCGSQKKYKYCHGRLRR